MSDENERVPPRAHFVQAINRKGLIRLVLRVCEKANQEDIAEELRRCLFSELEYTPGPTGPVEVHEDERDTSKITIVYKPSRRRNLLRDRRDIVRIVKETDISIGDKEADEIQQAFNTLAATVAPTHAGAESARRAAKTDPGGHGKS